MQLYLSEADHSEVANLDIDDTVKMEVIGKVVSVSIPSDDEPVTMDSSGRRATLQIAIERIVKKDVSLSEAVQRAGKKEGIFRMSVEPAP